MHHVLILLCWVVICVTPLVRFILPVNSAMSNIIDKKLDAEKASIKDSPSPDLSLKDEDIDIDDIDSDDVSQVRIAKRAKYSDSRFTSIFDTSYYSIGVTMVELYQPKVITLLPKQMKVTLYTPKGGNIKLVSIVFDSLELNKFYREVMPMDTKPGNIAKKHLTLVLKHDPSEVDLKFLRQIHSKAIDFCKTSKNLKISVIRKTGGDIVGSFNALYWEVYNAYSNVLGLSDDRDPHVSF